MLAALIVSLFVAGAFASLAVLADGTLRARNAWRMLRQDLVRIDTMERALVRVDVASPAPSIPALRPACLNGTRQVRRAGLPRAVAGVRAAA